jgi:ABC-type branched-subunit amino acid transport system ATPase component
MVNQKFSVSGIIFSSGAQAILKGVNFSVAQGEAVGIIGPNGSGKTTLFNVLSGFITSQSGKILFDGKDITSLPPHRRSALGLGRTFQNSGVFRDMTVEENIITVLEASLPTARLFLPWYKEKKQFKAKADSLLSEVGLDKFTKRRAGNLSGGQMRLLEVAMLKASQASLLLLDEPTAGVSPIMKQEVSNILRTLRNEGYTLIIIEHDIHFIQSLCDRVLVIDSGTVILEGTPWQIQSHPQLHATYFGVVEKK